MTSSLIVFWQLFAPTSDRSKDESFTADPVSLTSPAFEGDVGTYEEAIKVSYGQASGHNFLEQRLEQLRFLESPVAILRKRGVMRNFLIKTKTRGPPPGKMHPQFLDELALAADAVQIPNQQNPQQELWIDGWTTSFAIAFFQPLAHEAEVNVLINQPQQMVHSERGCRPIMSLSPPTMAIRNSIVKLCC